MKCSTEHQRERDMRARQVLHELRRVVSRVPLAAADLPETHSAIMYTTTELLDALEVWRLSGAEADVEPVEDAWDRCIAAWQRAADLAATTERRNAAAT